LCFAIYYIFFICFLASRAFAVEPSEILNDAKLEDRARNLSSNIRCLVCQNENIDSSESEFAKDLRLFIREQLVQGRTDDEIEEFLVSKYGSYILFKPEFTGYNIFLYLFGPFVFIFSFIMILLVFLNPKKGE
jgi:cytochrome c-type biogenesis protein CcmH